jgi:hypothetical protein
VTKTKALIVASATLRCEKKPQPARPPAGAAVRLDRAPHEAERVAFELGQREPRLAPDRLQLFDEAARQPLVLDEGQTVLAARKRPGRPPPEVCLNLLCHTSPQSFFVAVPETFRRERRFGGLVEDAQRLGHRAVPSRAALAAHDLFEQRLLRAALDLAEQQLDE